MKRGLDEARRIRAGTRRWALRHAEARRCRACGRKSAMVNVPNSFPTIRVCRWCKHETCAELPPPATEKG